MRFDHRILIGLTGAIGKMGPQSQMITNRVGLQIGRELGNELKERQLLREGMSIAEVWGLLNKELEFDPGAELAMSEGGMFTIKISSCNVCPKKVGKYPIPGTACPVGGILKGIGSTIGLLDFSTYPDLTPGEICTIAIPVDGRAD